MGAAPPASAGELLDKIPTPVIAGAGGPPQGGAGNATTHGNSQTDPNVTAMLVQLDARLRAAEACLYTSAFAPTNTRLSQDPVGALGVWLAAVKQDPQKHGLGGAEGLVGLALLRGISATQVPPTADRALLSRHSALIILYAALRETQPLELGEFIEHMGAADLQGNRKGWTLLSWRFNGRINLPVSDEDITTCQAATAQALAINSFEPILKLVSKCMDISDGEIRPAAPPGIPIDKVVLSIICQLGGTKNIGRAPPGALINNVKGRKR